MSRIYHMHYTYTEVYPPDTHTQSLISFSDGYGDKPDLRKLK